MTWDGMELQKTELENHIVECARVDVIGVVSNTTSIETVKDSRSIEDENTSDVIMDVLNGVVEVVNDSCRLGYQTSSSRLKQLWKLRGPMKVVDLKHDYFLVRFLEEDDYLHALNVGPWTIYGQTLSVQRWVPTFPPIQGSVNRAVMWVRFPDLPITRYYPGIITALGNTIGKTVKIDKLTLQA
ncbi:hypothetical protein K2173_016819 [Erythroxylum novogranatense]|uniref:DUF4283 domain-containing protein n=1 Tax=Erythroxylum novogranatense TaxID=1862640 RepID=A0AAV8SHT7_9ROSI|nr:hypothetical protein K2173_016819 [Erythroxylum novogranatense]